MIDDQEVETLAQELRWEINPGLARSLAWDDPRTPEVLKDNWRNGARWVLARYARKGGVMT